MYIKLTVTVFLFILLSCNGNTESDSKTVNTETTNTTDDDQTVVDIDAEKKALNEQSLACIALMNKLEVDQNAAYAAGDAATAAAIKARIDSAALENARIGQKLMALDK
jgi:hypothetical protein